jgi:hypothetical protein
MALKLIAFVCLVSVALAKHDSQSQLRGSIQQSDPAAKAVVEAKVEKVAAGKAKESTLHLKTSGDKVVTDNTAREGLGENLPYPGVDCTLNRRNADVCFHAYTRARASLLFVWD